jgi:hypothetical protein
VPVIEALLRVDGSRNNDARVWPIIRSQQAA